MNYEVVIGLEIHAQLLTESKLFCGDSTAFGAAPNTHVSPITLGHPGSLPKMNRKAIEYAIKMGIACNSRIERYNYFARKNYFYPDLPKGYQVSQHTTPICDGGFITIQTNLGVKQIKLNRIHLEEDAGKSIHDADPLFTCVDYNRAGTPLIEIVSEPDLRSAEEAFAYVTAVRKLVRYLGICDGNMEEGSLRCDANVSVRKIGDPVLGTKAEVKNLNSIRNVKKAIEVEAKRLIDLLESGGTVMQQTRSFDADNGTTFAIRDKEDADDYRYFPEPDLPPFQLQEEFIEKIRASLPELPEARINRYQSRYNLSLYDATQLAEDREVSDYFEETASLTKNYKAVANWLNGPVRTWLNEKEKDLEEFPIVPAKLVAVIDLIEKGTISYSIATSKIFPALLSEPAREPEEIIETENLAQQSDKGALGIIVEEVLLKFASKAEEYRKGKKGLLALFVGEAMKRSKGKADPKMLNELIIKKLEN